VLRGDAKKMSEGGPEWNDVWEWTDGASVINNNNCQLNNTFAVPQTDLDPWLKIILSDWYTKKAAKDHCFMIIILVSSRWSNSSFGLTWEGWRFCNPFIYSSFRFSLSEFQAASEKPQESSQAAKEQERALQQAVL
jgi:hypothetical protein